MAVRVVGCGRVRTAAPAAAHQSDTSWPAAVSMGMDNGPALSWTRLVTSYTKTGKISGKQSRVAALLLLATAAAALVL